MISSLPSVKMQTENANGVQVITFTQPPGLSSGAHHFASIRKDFVNQLKILAALQMLFGILCLVFETASVTVLVHFRLQNLAFEGYIFWFGIFVSNENLCK